MSQESKDQNAVSEILRAVYHGKQDVVAALLASGVSLDIFEAAATGQTTQLQKLIEQDTSLVNSYSPDGFTPLGLAVFFGHAETVDTLLAAGAEVNAAYRETMKLTPLASAMAVGRNDIARTLIAHGADVTPKPPTTCVHSTLQPQEETWNQSRCCWSMAQTLAPQAAMGRRRSPMLKNAIIPKWWIF